MTEAEAERITVRISHKLGTLADAYESVMPLIREAIERRAYVALGYPSVSAYAADRFDDSLGRLGVDRRRDVVKEFSAAGMSIRAIAPILGVGKDTVQRDQQAAGVSHETPDPPAKPGEVEADSSQEGFEESRLAEVTGLDGKVYTRPAQRAIHQRSPGDGHCPTSFGAPPGRTLDGQSRKSSDLPKTTGLPGIDTSMRT